MTLRAELKSFTMAHGVQYVETPSGGSEVEKLSADSLGLTVKASIKWT